MTSEFKFDGDNNTILIDGYKSFTRMGSETSGNGIFSIGKDTNWNSFVDSTSTFFTTNLSIGSLGGLLKATAGVVGIAGSGTDYEPPVTKGNLTESGSSVITFGGNTSNNVLGAGTTISIHKASAAQDGYLGKDDWNIFNEKQSSIIKYDLSETSSDILTITGGTDSVLTNDVTIAVQKASAAQDGYLGKNDFSTFSAKEPALTKGNLTSNTESAITVTSGNGAVIGSGTSITINKSSASSDGYLGKDNWTTFNAKEPALAKGNLTEASSDILVFGGTTTNNVVGSGTSIQVKKASASQDGYLGKNDWSTFNSKVSGPGSATNEGVARFDGTTGKLIQNSSVIIGDDGYVSIPSGQKYKINGVNLSATDVGAEPTLTKYNLSETVSGILTITGGPSSVVTNAVTIQVKKASASQDGYLGKDNWTTFNSKGDMVLGSIQTNTAAKTFNDATLVLAGSSSGTTTLKANATAGTTTQTFQAVTGNVYCSGGTDVAYTDGGTGLSTYPTRTIILLAGGAALGTTTPATRETREMATNKQVVDVLKFAVAGVNIAWFCFPIPDAFDSGTFVLTIQYFNATADSGKFVVFQAAMSAAADGEAIDVSLGTTQIIKSSCSATNNFQKWTTFPAITASPTPAPTHQMFIKLWRDPAHADDDSVVDAYVESIKVEFTANSWSD